MGEFRNQEYWVSFRNFFKRLFSEITGMPESSIPKEPIYVPEMYKEGGHGFQLVIKPSISALTDMLIEKIKEWPEYDKLVENAVFPGCYGDIWKDNDRFYMDRNFIPSIVWKLYEKAETSFQVTDTQLAEQYQLIENALCLDKYSFRIVAPLHHVELSTREIALAQGVSLRELEKKDLVLFRLSIHHSYHGVMAYNPFLKTLIVTEETKEKGAPSGVSAETYELFINISAAIAVYTGKPIQLGPIFSERSNFWCMASGIEASSRLGQVPRMNGQFVKMDDPSGFQSFCSSYIASSRTNPWLSLCNRRLLRIGDEMNMEDTITDIVTILEIIYLPESAAELKYRLCVRCSKLLASDSNSCQHLFGLLSAFYDVRSSIVHSGQITKSAEKKVSKLGMKVGQLIEEVQSLLLRSLRLLGINPNIRSELDSCVMK